MLKEEILWQIGKLGRLRFWYLARHRRGVLELFVGLNNALAIGLLGLIAHLTSWPLIFPSLGPSLFLIFYAPQRAISSPRNTLLGHLLGGGLGFLIYLLFQKLGFFGPSFGYAQVISAALALGLSGFLLVRLRLLHPPAASTALIAATGYLPDFSYLLILAMAISFILFQAKILHTLAGLPYPLWAPFEEEDPEIFASQGRLRFGRKDPENFQDLADLLITRGKPNHQDR